MILLFSSPRLSSATRSLSKAFHSAAYALDSSLLMTLLPLSWLSKPRVKSMGSSGMVRGKAEGTIM